MSGSRQPNQSLNRRMQSQHEERIKQAEISRAEADKRRSQDTTAAAKAAAGLLKNVASQPNQPIVQKSPAKKPASRSLATLPTSDNISRPKQYGSAPSVATAAYHAAQSIGNKTRNGSDNSTRSISKESPKPSPTKSSPIKSNNNRVGSNGLPMAPPELPQTHKTPESQSATAASMMAFKRKQKLDQEEKERQDREQKAQEQMYALQERLYHENHTNRGQSPHSFLSVPRLDTESDLSDAVSTNSQEKRRSVSRNRHSPFALFSTDTSNPEFTHQFISDAARIASNKQNVDDADSLAGRSSSVEHASNNMSRVSVDEAHLNQGINALAAAVAAKSNVDDAVEKLNNVIGAPRDNNFARYQPAATWTGFHSTTLRNSRKRDGSSSRERSEPIERRSVSRERSSAPIGDDDGVLSDEAIEHQRKFLQERSQSVESTSSKTAKKKKSRFRSKLDFITKLSGSKDNVPNDRKEHALLSTMRSNKQKNFNEDKPWKHHRNALVVTEKEKKRYEGLWAANKGLQVPFMTFDGDDYGFEASDDDDSDDSDFSDDESHVPSIKVAMEEVHGIVVRELWRRSRIADSVLENIWNLVDRTRNGGLGRDEFLVGMWLVDQCLYGRKMPTKIDSQVWNSVARLNLEIRVKNKSKDGQIKKSKRKHKKKNRRQLVVVHPAHI